MVEGQSSYGGTSTSTERRYREQGWGAEPIGFGVRPCLVVVDMQVDFVDPNAPSTCAPIAQERLPAIQVLLAAARASALPIFFTKGIVEPNLVGVGLWKSAAHRHGRVQMRGSPGAEIVPELAPVAGEHVIEKFRPSAFFATPLDFMLRAYDIDTILLAGSSMSGCVRATTVDAFSLDYRVMIVRECVIDRSMAVLESNLFDVNAKYADDVTLADVRKYLKNRGGAPDL